MGNHTPGPWETGAGGCDCVYGPKIDGHQQFVARCPGQFGARDYDYRVVAANAKLIACAPELLEALERIAEYPLPYCETDAEKIETLLRFMDFARARARATIAKAKGQPQ